MSDRRSEVQSVLDTYYEAFKTMNKAGVLAVFTQDADFIDFTMGRNMKGRDELAGFIDETWRLSPYFRLEPQMIVIDDDQVAVQLFMSGSAKVDAAGDPIIDLVIYEDLDEIEAIERAERDTVATAHLGRRGVVPLAGVQLDPQGRRAGRLHHLDLPDSRHASVEFDLAAPGARRAAVRQA